ncbi:hypothetical protein F443_23181, partial [Phytophthora nicotianae P1569]
AALESSALNSDALRQLSLSSNGPPIAGDADHIFEQPYGPVQSGGDYPGLKDSYYGSSAAIRKVEETPLVLFLIFFR